jgi:hypothetical protein
MANSGTPPRRVPAEALDLVEIILLRISEPRHDSSRQLDKVVAVGEPNHWQWRPEYSQAINSKAHILHDATLDIGIAED